MSKESKSVALPAEVYSRLEEMVKDTGFGSVDEYVLFILEEVLKEEGEKACGEEDKKEAEERLKAWVLSVLEQL